MNRTGQYRWLYVVLLLLLALWLIGKIKLVSEAFESDPTVQPVKVRCTCYLDEGVTASGAYTRPMIMAAQPKYIGYTACVNAINEDGSIGEFIGYYEILDTGYGRETGWGESKIKKGKTVGTIEAGETVDIWMPTMHQAEEWIDTYGDYVYVYFIPAEG